MAKPHYPRSFEPVYIADGSDEHSLSSSGVWKCLIQCKARFPAELFQVAADQLLNHPEYNSTLILRSEPLSDWSSELPQFVLDSIPKLAGYRAIRCIHRKLLPRRPLRDPEIQQYCTYYARTGHPDEDPTILILTPLWSFKEPLPYYHPSVEHLALRYLPPSLSLEESSLRISVITLPNIATDPNSRLYRTSLSLLDTLHRYGWGSITQYQKRVMHDRIIPRETYQDYYQLLREKYKHLVGTWSENTDPLKHVFEDIGIATYLILLWREMFPGQGQPPGGFLDFGCGNGLLTHILVSEGFGGHGIDVRARTSWATYAERTRKSLHVHAFDPRAVINTSEFDIYLRPGTFIIGNHADELTPWVPVLSTLKSGSGYLSIPCCPWAFDERYTKTFGVMFSELEDDVTYDSFIETLYLESGATAGNLSAYSAYRIWLASLSLHCGWIVECDTLRIPSTRNWGIIGRKRRDSVESAKENAQAVLKQVLKRNIFKARTPETLAQDH